MILYLHHGKIKSKEFISSILKTYHGIDAPVFTENCYGKPYLEDNSLYFNLSHSGNSVVLAVADREIGVDAEEIKNRKYERILSKFSEEERKEVNDLHDFLVHWTKKEAYVKFLGTSIAKELNALDYHENTLYQDGLAQSVFLKTIEFPDLIVTVCSLNEEEIKIIHLS